MFRKGNDFKTFRQTTRHEDSIRDAQVLHTALVALTLYQVLWTPVPSPWLISLISFPVTIPFSPSNERIKQKTSVCKKTLNPVWEEEFKFEVADDSVLQNEPIEFRVSTLSKGPFE